MKDDEVPMETLLVIPTTKADATALGLEEVGRAPQREAQSPLNEYQN